MRKRLKKKLCCPKCGARGFIKMREGGILCFPCERRDHQAMREIMHELGKKIPYIGVIQRLGWGF